MLYCQHYMPALRTWQHKCIIGRAIWKEPSRKLKVVDLKVLTLRASTTASEPVDPAQMEQTSAISPWSGLAAPGVCGSLFGPNLFDLLELMRPANRNGGPAPTGSGMGDMAKPRQPSGNVPPTATRVRDREPSEAKLNCIQAGQPGSGGANLRHIPLERLGGAVGLLRAGRGSCDRRRNSLLRDNCEVVGSACAREGE